MDKPLPLPWRSLSTLGWNCDCRRSKEIYTRIGKANTILRELYRSVVTKRKISNTAQIVSF